AIEVGGRDAEVAHAGRGIGQLLLQVALGEDRGEYRVAVARLRVAAGAVALEKGVRRACRLGAGRCGDRDVLDQMSESRAALGVVIAADLVEYQERDVSRSPDGA